jgi:GH25 family lysozyme M1 (1,4-beta-N-acetylmuramidase)
MPNGVNKVLLFDNDVNRMYIKSYDNNGRPRVLEDNDFQPHVEPEPKVSGIPNVDMSKYATKDDIEQLFRKIPMPNMSGYMTKQEFDTALTELFVDNRGRIVRNSESDA